MMTGPEGAAAAPVVDLLEVISSVENGEFDFLTPDAKAALEQFWRIVSMSDASQLLDAENCVVVLPADEGRELAATFWVTKPNDADEAKVKHGAWLASDEDPRAYAELLKNTDYIHRIEPTDFGVNLGYED